MKIFKFQNTNQLWLLANLFLLKFRVIFIYKIRILQIVDSKH